MPYDQKRVVDAIRAFEAGEIVVVMDDDDRENEGDLIVAAVHCTPDKMAFIVRHTSGIVCTPMPREEAKRLNLNAMVAENDSAHTTAFTVSVAPGVETYIQVGSEAIMRYAEERGYVELFEAVGARLLPPSCGACINAGPGASYSPDEVTVSAQNRNFPGRSGPGQVYLASPYVVAATAIAGRLSSVEEMFDVDGAR